MKRLGMILTMMIATTIYSLECVAQSSPTNPTWETKWSNGFKVTSSDGQYKMKFGGRIMADYTSTLNSANQHFDSNFNATQGVEFRRVRMFTSGTIYKNVSFKLQFDFASGEAVLKDAYISISKIPIAGTIKIGHFKEPIGLETLTSSKYITFIERAVTGTLAPERNTGIMVYNKSKNKKMTWALGYFYPSGKQGKGLYDGNITNLTGRITGIPIYEDGEKFKMVHLGLSLTRQDFNHGDYSLSQRPEAHLTPKLVKSKVKNTSDVNQYGIEVAGVFGSFSIQGEYISATANAYKIGKTVMDNDAYNFSAYYAYASYFITGEHRSYKKSAGAFSRVKPKSNFGDGGTGAFEIGVRYSVVNLNDADAAASAGSEMSSITVGVNWHLNPATRIMVNYINADVTDQGVVNPLVARFQVDF